MNLTESELLDELRRAMAEPHHGGEEGMTVREICDAFNAANPQRRLTDLAARRLVRDQIATGKMATCRVHRPAIDGRLIAIPAYRLT